MKPALLEWIVCPVCLSTLNLRILRGDKYWLDEGIFRCANDHVFPLIEGIPVLIEPRLRARVLGTVETDFWKRNRSYGAGSVDPSDTAHAAEKAAAAEVWGYQWQASPEIWKDLAGEEQYYRWIHPLVPSDFEGRAVLDAGCGTGRHVIYSSRHGARLAIGADLSFATRVAARNTMAIEAAHIVQADIYQLPFRPETFDRILSIGVIHHLPEPKAAYQSLLPFARPGGTVTIWVYGLENNWFAARALEACRGFTRRMPLPLLKYLSLVPAIILHAIIQWFYVPWNSLAPNASGHLPYNQYFLLFSRLSFRNLWTMIFDQLDAPIANYYRREEVAAWLEESGLADPHLTHTNDISWTLHGTKRP